MQQNCIYWVLLNKILCNNSENVALILMKKFVFRIRLHDIEPLVSIYLNVSKDVFFVAKNRSQPRLKNREKMNKF